MFWKNWSWPERILSVVGLGVIGAILFPVFARSPGGSHGPSCQSNLKQIGLGILQYTQDYNGKLPPVATGHSAYGWADAIYPYIKSASTYHCPQTFNAEQPVNGQFTPRKSGYTDYPFNARMDGRALAQIDEPSGQVLLLDGNYRKDVTNARYSFRQIPALWRENTDSPLYRHKGMANYVFADGHVKQLVPAQVEDASRPVF